MSRRVYVGNLSSRVREADLEDEFKRYGPISRIDMKAGYCFVEFNDPRDAGDAVHKGDGMEFFGRRLFVEPAKGGGREGARNLRHTEHRIRIENISSRMSWQDLKDEMRYQRLDGFVFVDVARDERGAPFAVVEFETSDHLRRAIRKLDDLDVNGHRLRCIDESPRGGSRDDRYSPYNRGGRGGRSRSRSPPPRSRSPPPRDRRSHSRSPPPKSRDGDAGGRDSPRAASPRASSRSPSPVARRSPSP